jgi:NTE family protein
MHTPMIKHYLTVISLLVFIGTSYSQQQKVGLVLSGGGAKGIAHIGVLKALEEHNIPINYIVGTSMGGIVGGCYAAGMSPKEIETMVLSDDFLRWVNGQPEPGQTPHYFAHDENPGFIKLNFNLDSTLTAKINSSLANDVSLNFALAEKMAQAEAISKRNFDSLFVPFRAMASEVFTQNQVVLGSGSLSSALRATQTVPFFYTPIRINEQYLFDGGVYNNFPVDVMQKTFNPEVIIGCNVSSKVFEEYPYKDDDALLNTSMLYMFLDKSDPDQIPPTGVYIQPDLKGYTAIDFTQARALIDSGYVQTIKQLAEIKTKVSQRIAHDELAAKRAAFTTKSKPFLVDEVILHRYNSKQQVFLNRFFDSKTLAQKPLTSTTLKRKYHQLVSEEYFSTVFPTISFNQQRKKFALELTRRQQRNFTLDFGGVVATRDISNIFVGVNFFHFDKQLVHHYIGFHAGNFYKSLVGSLRVDFPFINGVFIEPNFTYNNWDFLESNDLLQDDNPTVLKRTDRDYSIKMGWPVGGTAKVYLQAGGISNNDFYSNDKSFRSDIVLDELELNGVKAGIHFSKNSLNRKQYASSGSQLAFSAWYFEVEEKYNPGNTSITLVGSKRNHQWVQAKIHYEQYFSRSWFKPGLVLEAAYSSMPHFRNYKGTLINLPAFQPLPESRTLLLENYRAFSYAAGGAKMIVSFSSKFEWRSEGYFFKPLVGITESLNQRSVTESSLLDGSFVAMTGLVAHTPIGPISLMGNYYNDTQNQYGLLLHIGFLLFNNTSTE